MPRNKSLRKPGWVCRPALHGDDRKSSSPQVPSQSHSNPGPLECPCPADRVNIISGNQDVVPGGRATACLSHDCVQSSGHPCPKWIHPILTAQVTSEQQSRKECGHNLPASKAGGAVDQHTLGNLGKLCACFHTLDCDCRSHTPLPSLRAEWSPQNDHWGPLSSSRDSPEPISGCSQPLPEREMLQRCGLCSKANNKGAFSSPLPSPMPHIGTVSGRGKKQGLEIIYTRMQVIWALAINIPSS